MPRCPYCGRWFRTRQGLKIHIGKAHMTDGFFGERILDPLTFDPFGYIERKLKKSRKKRNNILW